MEHMLIMCDVWIFVCLHVEASKHMSKRVRDNLTGMMAQMN